jgi:uncharacterized membrane protein YsdA (DUF1294 family)
MPDISNIKILLLYLIIINSIGLALFGLDKWRAKSGA